MDSGVKTTFEGLSGPCPVDVVAKIGSPDAVTSPLSGACGAVVVIDVVERIGPLEREVGRVVLGDTLSLHALGGELRIVARRSSFVFVGNDTGGAPLERAPPEIAFALAGATGAGALAWREHVLRNDARVRVRAIVEPSAPRLFVARVDLAQVVVAEIVG